MRHGCAGTKVAVARPNNAINMDGKLAGAFGAHSFAAGYGEC
jgi:hypothetical protein